MSFDLSKVMKDAKKSVENQSNNGGGFKFPLLYPQPGKLSFQLFYNPKSNSAIRQILRHRIDGKQVPCLRTYNQECPICKAIEDVKNSTGKELWGSIGSKNRSIMYVQYVSSDYEVKNRDATVNPNSTVLLMVPKTVAGEINAIMNNAGDNLGQIIASNESMIINIDRDSTNSYSTQLDPFKKNKAFESDDKFNEALNDLPDLNEAILPPAVDDNVRMEVNSVATTIRNKYMGNSNMSNPNTYVQDNGQPQSQQPQGNPFSQPQGNPFSQPQPQSQGGQQPQGGQPQEQGNPFSQPQNQQPQGNPFSQSSPDEGNPFSQPQNQQPQGNPFSQPQNQQPQGNPFSQSSNDGGNPFSQPQNQQPQGNPFSK